MNKCKYPHLFEPIMLGNTLFRNRIFASPTGYQSLSQLMALPNPPTAILSTNHDITMGLITAARERGYKLPEQIDIFGYDSLEACSIMTPPIPVVYQPENEIARTAASFLVDRLNGFEGDIRQVRLESQLML